MNCSMRVGVIATSLAAAALLSGAAQADTIVPGVYYLNNHPDGGAAPPLYGLRLDELFDVTGDHDRFTFDFDAAGSFMRMEYDGSSIHIWGTAYGGLDTGTGYGNATYASWVTIDFTYNIGVGGVPGDDDVWVDTANYANSGTITWHDSAATGSAVVFDLVDYRGSHPFSFRMGDGDADTGHRGEPGISGWGWLNHSGAPNGITQHIGASDWLFRAQLVPLPPAVFVGAAGLGLVALRRRRRKAAAA